MSLTFKVSERQIKKEIIFETYIYNGMLPMLPTTTTIFQRAKIIFVHPKCVEIIVNSLNIAIVNFSFTITFFYFLLSPLRVTILSQLLEERYLYEKQ